MSYCLNPLCPDPTDSHNRTAEICASCGFQLLLQGRFRALKPIGQGGFGRTFLAVDEQQPGKPRCVIKQSMPDQLTHREHAVALFHQEAMRLAELGQHPQIPELIAHCDQENYQYLVQEFIDGQTLAQALAERGQFTPAEIDQILHSLLPVLDFIHSHEVIHRDIKPDNIIRRAGGQLVLVDFGAAKHATGTALLKTGTSIGSAEFIAPEQARGKATYASDLYSLGVTCVHLLTQMSPFDLIDGDNQWVWPDWLESPVSPELQHCLNRLIAPASNRRFQSAKDVQDFLAHPQLPTTPPLTEIPAEVAVMAQKLMHRRKWLKSVRQQTISTIKTTITIGIFSLPLIAAAALVLPAFLQPGSKTRTNERCASQSCKAQVETSFQASPTTTALAIEHYCSSQKWDTLNAIRTNVSSMNRAQQAYFLEHDKFTSDLAALEICIPEEPVNYQYITFQSFQTPPGKHVVVNMAIPNPKKRVLRSYIGYVWLDKSPATGEATTPTLLCESDTPTGMVGMLIAEPLFVKPKEGGPVKAQCPNGFSDVALKNKR